ncbi:MAG TPA: hypothetical protein VLU46_04650 [Thermoanaerobaculia bacterium]|nr:hypothetical protein [Thermoanaerobaculia bacterium]
MDPAFERATILVVIGSLVVFGIGATLLAFAFRGFRTAQRGDVKHIALLVATIAFVLMACLALLVWSTLQRG